MAKLNKIDFLLNLNEKVGRKENNFLETYIMLEIFD